MEYIIADPAGNITAFILGAVDTKVAADLLAHTELRIEQVAFLNDPQRGGHIKCDMAGGEFCGNACRAAGYYYCIKNGLTNETDVLVEMSGVGDAPVTVKVFPEKDAAYADMPLPKRITTARWNSQELDAVEFDGITHIIAPLSSCKLSDISKESMHELCLSLKTSALGIMYLSDNMHLKPLVWVDKVGSLVWENSCGSGSTACACWLSRNKKAGHWEYSFLQPGGVLEIRIEKSADGCKIRMGGRVRLLDDPLIRCL